ncbi:MAG: lipoyl synthase [Acidobacteria bacterium]|nr:lipoyl synthase [Acidobacteriota bacterium]
MTVKRKPSWLRVPPPWGSDFKQVNNILKEYGLETVCKNANCPNIGECYNSGTATFLIMGNVCTRNCRFCNIQGGKPEKLDVNEPKKVAKAVQLMGLKYSVITSVTRDDVPDGGAEHFAETIRRIRELSPECDVEVLVPDFRGSEDSVKTVLDAEPTVFNHNVETVPRLYKNLRPGADYRQSLDLLKFAHLYRNDIPTKSGLMVGAGETIDELKEVFTDLAIANVQLLTIGQYLPPSREHHPLDRFYSPDEFDQLKLDALSAGLKEVTSAPLVRSSYHAQEMENRLKE